MTTLREKNYTSDHHRAWQAFFQKMKNLHVLFSFEQQGFTKKRQTHLHTNIIILLVLSSKKTCEKLKAKIKTKRKKIIITKKTVFLILCAAPLLCVLPIIKKNFKLCKTNQQDLKNTHCKRQSLLYVKLRSATEENL